MNCDLSVGFINHLRLPLMRPRMPFIGALFIGAGFRIGAGRRIGLGLAIGRGLGLDILIGAGLDGRIGCGLGLLIFGGDGRFTGVPGAFPALPYAWGVPLGVALPFSSDEAVTYA